MQFPGQAKPPLGVIFDSAMGFRIDDALALALLFGLDGKTETRVASVSVSIPSLKSAAFCEVIARFYGARNLPIGMATGGKPFADTPMLTVPLEKKNSQGAQVYTPGIRKLNDTAEVRALIRNAFTAQQDQDSVVVLTGPATNLAAVLDLYGAKDLICRKVQLLSIAAGSFANQAPEPKIKEDIPAARKLFAEWPTPIVAVGSEIGEAIRYPASSIEKDFAWAKDHPVVDAYRAFHSMPYDAPTTAMASVLYAVRPKEGYFRLSEPGEIQVTDEGHTRFVQSPHGKHRYLMLDPGHKERVLQAYTEIASAKPAPRRLPFQKKQDDAAKKKEEPKKDEQKKPF
ncbi:MAG: nucleoside hydrolase [Bryobacterales bacterium]|nr:nucleoside hydrolase [Bryobacterales bacterium]